MKTWLSIVSATVFAMGSLTGIAMKNLEYVFTKVNRKRYKLKAGNGLTVSKERSFHGIVAVIEPEGPGVREVSFLPARPRHDSTIVFAKGLRSSKLF